MRYENDAFLQNIDNLTYSILLCSQVPYLYFLIVLHSSQYRIASKYQARLSGLQPSREARITDVGGGLTWSIMWLILYR